MLSLLQNFFSTANDSFRALAGEVFPNAYVFLYILPDIKKQGTAESKDEPAYHSCLQFSEASLNAAVPFSCNLFTIKKIIATKSNNGARGGTGRNIGNMPGIMIGRNGISFVPPPCPVSFPERCTVLPHHEKTTIQKM